MNRPKDRTQPHRSGRLAAEAYVEGVAKGDRSVLARAITLIESQRPDDRERAQEVLAGLAPEAGGSVRLGVSGVPGVGKSTFLDCFGSYLTAQDKRIAVLAVDPSSRRTGGSILGDKTRMARLSGDDKAFIRPSPSAGTLGGVARATAESLVLCEAFGAEVVIVETVGVGQSETLVSDMVDCFLLLMLPGAGDELQGIKKGVLELADIVIVNKADGDNQARARAAARDLGAALRLLTPQEADWPPPVMTISALEGNGIAEVWDKIEEHQRVMQDNGRFEIRRSEQAKRSLWRLIEQGLIEQFRANPAIRAKLETLERQVMAGEITPGAAASHLLAFETLP
ncbi:MAG: methylmalonyl Co-A mutase-associated GTPase MeaB [Geminicoccaceae bacterium]